MGMNHTPIGGFFIRIAISGVKLLVRWHIPKGEIIPAYFINRMESVGLLFLLRKKY